MEYEIWRYYRTYLRHYIEMYLTKKERFFYAIKRFNAKFFYHGTEKNWKKLDEFYDAIFMRIPPGMELLIKGIVFGLAVYCF